MKALLIDHDDSFTYNLRDWLKPAFEKIEVLNHRDLDVSLKLEADLIVLSPGPKHPKNYPHIHNLLKSLPAHQAVLGVCRSFGR